MTSSNCRLSGAEKLIASIGGPEIVCEAIEAAAREHAPHVPFDVEVRMVSPSMMEAIVTLKNGRKLPEQKISISDSVLNRRSIERFAEAIARQAAGAAGS